MRLQCLRLCWVPAAPYERWSVLDADDNHLGWVDQLSPSCFWALTPDDERLPQAKSRTVAAQQLQMHHALRSTNETDQRTVG